MKILLVNKFHFQKGGAETYYFTLADLLRRAGHQVVFFSMKHKNNLKCNQDYYFVENREYVKKSSLFAKLKAFKNFIYSKEAYKNISELIEKEKPDLAILNNIHRQLTTSIIDALYEHNIKIYWVVHDLIMLCPNYQMLDGNGKICEDCCTGEFKNCIIKKCVKNSKIKSYLAVKEAKYNLNHRTYDMIDLFITPSNFYRKKLIEYGFNPNKIKYVPNPLSINFEFENNNKDDGYILYFGRLSREKGIKNLIDAMKNIDYKLVILGTGPLENELKQYSKNYKNIIFEGFKTGDELYGYISKARCVVLPSEWYENGPYSAMEALGKGKPLIVSNNGGLSELVTQGENGYIFNNVDELSFYLKKIIEDCDYDMMCYKAYKKAKSSFDPEKYLEKLDLDNN